jgi:hypothetical protein
LSLDSFVQKDVTTPLGVVGTWTSPTVDATVRPLVFAIPGFLSTTDNLIKLGESLGLLADLCLMRLPSNRSAALSTTAPADLARMVSGLIEEMFPGRPVVLLGESSGALIALGVRSSNLARVIAIEPPLATGNLWPIVGPLRKYLGDLCDPMASAFVFDTLGLDEARSETRSQLGLLDGLNVPVDVVLGKEPLQPLREVARFPSLVDLAERQVLAATPGVRLHILPGTGHNVLGQAFRATREIVLEGCRRASAMPGPDRLRVDEPLLEAVPLTARRILYRGADADAFGAAFWALNPKCEVATAAGDGDLFDAVVLASPPMPEELAAVAAPLRPNGHLIVRWGAEPEALQASLAAHGLTLREAVDDGGTGVVRAQKLALDAAPGPALALMSVAYSPLLMDIRTRLPARGLRSDPELSVTYETPPFKLPTLPCDRPKVLLLQRPAETRLEAWAPFIAQCVRDGWLVVLEYDDNPALIAEVKGLESSEADMLRFGYVHAVQTSTPPLLEAFRPYNPETILFPNSAFDLASFPKGERPLRVFYGGVLRGRYPIEVARSLGPAIDQHPQAEFVVIGDREVFAALPTASKRYYEYMPFEAYLDLMSQCCVSLSPIEALPMRETKSDAKFLDASRAGVLTIASPTIYDRAIEHGVNGLLAAQVEDWAPLLARALSEAEWRQGMARRAWTYVREERMFADQVALRRDWYLDLWARRAELNEAVMARISGVRAAVEG